MTLSSIKQQLMLPQFANGLFEQGLNYLMQRSEGIEPHLRKLNGKVLSISFKQGGHAYLIFSHQRIDVLANYEGDADCVVTADANVLWQRPQKGQLADFINRQQIVFQGDLQVLQETVALFEQLEKDPAELLSPYLGDVAAHMLTRGAQQLQQQLTKQLQTSERHWGERLTEEWQLIAPTLALVHFYDQVASLEQDLQRLEAKINRLTGTV
ncbi:ubiquinone biosynthesis accessory factor UbiJ [Gallibacterium genomosp. 3]|uniref:Ubiquinone biosynthesis accessory factor UbiJ n=1 Tax=Gallibacterium genomosp. 3 TaxID=505345 RepID=A0A1A7PZK3_9PAST|nr:SCP2 sterol-binding domain-containing protein [Gallibacterium genomosp. 3]OBX07211.1 SCP-2 sterol transfer family protein [Gallibacterium genomosp. 3]